MMWRNSLHPLSLKQTGLKLFAVGFVGFVALLTFSGRLTRHAVARHASPALANAPNILLIIGDDHAADTLGVNGDTHGATPRLDALAKQGVNFRKAYCNAPVCTASRQSLITGRLPHATGVTRLPTPLPESSVTLADWLLGRGYVTGAFGKMHFNSQLKHGFETRIDTADWANYLKLHPPVGGDHRVPWHPFKDPAPVWLNAAGRSEGLPDASMEATFFANKADAFFKSHKTEPFLLVVSFNEPHSPFRFPDDWTKRFTPNDFEAPTISDFDRAHQPKIFKEVTPEQTQGIAASYYTSISYVDSKIGRILDALDASGEADNTIVVYIGDNGYNRGHRGRFEKHCFYERAVHVPMIIRWPGHIPAGKQVDALVEHLDILPTVLELAGVPAPANIQGESRVGLLFDRPGAKGRETVLSEYLENEEAMVSDGRFKLIVGTGTRKRTDGYETDNPTPGPYLRLYDQRTDPEETTDIAGREDAQPVVKRLQAALYQRITTTRNANDQVPAGLGELAAIRWCLRPRD